MKLKKNRESNPNYYKKWYKNNPNYHREWVKNNPDKVKANREKRKKKQAEYYRKWYRTKGRKRNKQQLESMKMWKELNPESHRISKLICYAIKIGKIKRPRICEMCEEKRKLVAHHEDYNYPFRIKWLCYSCHKKLHNNRGIDEKRK